MANHERRLATSFKNFATDFEFSHNVDSEGKEGNLGLPVDNTMVHVRFEFANTDDSYEYGATVKSLNMKNSNQFANRLMRSKPVAGITERIVGDDVVLLGQRNGLKDQPESHIRRGFMDDVSRISTQVRQVWSLSCD